MACLHPILIKNRRYCNQPDDYMASMLLLHPEDIARQYLLVPCGHCSECLRAERNSWFVRLNREFEFQRAMRCSTWFVTLTIAPRNYRAALDNPSGYIRRFFEKIRHVYGKSIKHAFFTEFSPKKGRMHFHGLLFGPNITFSGLHEIAKDFGFIWAEPARAGAVRYVVKYIVKDIGARNASGQLLDRKYRRKFVSAHVGDYLGCFPPPSFDTRNWNFYDRRYHITYTYSIPRYYDKYMPEKDKRQRAIDSAFVAATDSGDDFASAVILEVAQEFFGARFVEVFSPESVSFKLHNRRLREAFRPDDIPPETLYTVQRDETFLTFDNHVKNSFH